MGHLTLILVIGFLAAALGAAVTLAFVMYRRHVAPMPREHATELRQTAGPLAVASAALEVRASAPPERVSTAHQMPPVANSPTAIRIAAGDAVLGEVALFDGDAARWNPVKDARIVRGVETLVRGLPLTALATQHASRAVYHLKYTAEAARHLADGSWSHMIARTGGLRANLVDGSHIIRGQAAVVPIPNPAAAALVVWQVLAMVTAQKFLSDIDRKLAAIEDHLGRMQVWLEGDRRGKLVGNLSYIKQVVAALRAQAPNEADLREFASQLESVERQCQQIEAACSSAIEAAIGELAALRVTKTWKFKEDKERLHANLGGFVPAAFTAALSAQVRGAATQARAALPLGEEVTRLRAKDVAQSVATLRELQDRYLRVLDDKIPQLQGKVARRSVEDREQMRLRVRLLETQKQLAPAMRELQERASWLEENLRRELHATPVEFLVELGPDGTVKQLHEPGARR